MGDSLPAAEAPEASETSEARPTRRRWRIPMPLIVTVLVAALTAWVAPAITQQWDDRQKAQELKAAVANEIAVEGTRSIIAASTAPRPGERPAVARAQRQRWAEQAAVIDARFSAYFPNHIEAQWTQLVDQVVFLMLVRNQVRQ